MSRIPPFFKNFLAWKFAKLLFKKYHLIFWHQFLPMKLLKIVTSVRIVSFYSWKVRFEFGSSSITKVRVRVRFEKNQKFGFDLSLIISDFSFECTQGQDSLFCTLIELDQNVNFCAILKSKLWNILCGKIQILNSQKFF